MQIEIISFTEQGKKQADKIKNIVEKDAEVHMVCGRNMELSLQEWCREAFLKSQVLIFVGAAGIAVRIIAPFVKDKFTDPAVLVVDEKGKFVIPILSGHAGGANEYASVLAGKLSAEAVITTATDLNGKFAVDVFARKNQLILRDRAWAKDISAAVLRGEPIAFSCEGKMRGKMPGELVIGHAQHQISVGIHTENNLHPKAVTLGIGCRRGKPVEEIEEFVQKQLRKHQIALESVISVASVEQKKEEQGLILFCQKYDLPFRTFSAQQLREVPGDFEESQFVEEKIGVGNVCERAAICAQGLNQARIILHKTAERGMTLAIAEKDWSVIFE